MAVTRIPDRDIKLMASFSADSLIAIYGVVREGQCALRGTATLLTAENRVFVLSAKHVFESGLSYQYFAHSAGNGQPPQKIAEISRVESRSHDLTLIEILPESLEGIGRRPVTREVFESHGYRPNETEALFLHGFPGGWSVPKPPNQLHNRSLPQVVCQVDRSRRPSGAEIYVHYEEGGNQDLEGNIIDVPDPHGLSGSALWHPKWQEEEGKWSYTDAKVIGVVIEWFPDKSMLKCSTAVEARKLMVRIL